MLKTVLVYKEERKNINNRRMDSEYITNADVVKAIIAVAERYPKEYEAELIKIAESKNKKKTKAVKG